jgi:alkylhydroperoxidase/carboxymuconolactone decarboxylase family protein
MSKDKSYYNPEDLKKFGNITEFQKELGEKYFEYYGSVFKDGALTAREKALIALAVSHAEKCPYCIDAYTADCLKKGADEEQMMEAVHVAAAIRSGVTLVHGVQMMNKTKDLLM